MDRRFWLFFFGGILAAMTYPVADAKFHPVVFGVVIVYALIAFGWFLHSVSANAEAKKRG